LLEWERPFAHYGGMDQELFDLLKPDDVLASKHLQKTPKPHVLDVTSGEIVVEQAGEERRYAIKLLPDLYGPGNNVDTVDPQDERFMPLFLAIEEAILQYRIHEAPGLTDGAVALVVDQLGMGPESAMQDPLAMRVQLGIRLCLSMNNYSRHEVKAALKKIGKSVDRHTRAEGPRGYLNFIARFFAPKP
jgi:hypothetical protein